jgi:hypothetical protein
MIKKKKNESSCETGTIEEFYKELNKPTHVRR